MQGTLDVKEVDLVRKRNNIQSPEKEGSEKQVLPGDGVSPGKNLVVVPVTHSMQGGKSRLRKPKVIKRGAGQA